MRLLMSCQKPYICERNRIKRVKWAKEHKNLTVDQWRKVFWTDESPFVLQENCKKRVWKLHDEKYAPNCITGTVKHDKKIIVWGGFLANGGEHFAMDRRHYN